MVTEHDRFTYYTRTRQFLLISTKRLYLLLYIRNNVTVNTITLLTFEIYTFQRTYVH